MCKNIYIFIFLLVCLPACATKEKRHFHRYTIAEVTAEEPTNWKHPLTHLEVEGFVTYKAHEADGDWHLRICDAANVKGMDVKRCIVAEIIPELPIAPITRFGGGVDIGIHIRVRGIYRYDGENPGHHWHEIHPVLHIEVVGEESGELAPLPEPKWIGSENGEGHWSCPEGFHEPEVKEAGWRCQADGEAQ